MRCGAAILTLLLGLLILGRMPRVRQPGYLVMGGLVALVTTGLLVLIDATSLEYIDPSDLAMIVAMAPLVFLACYRDPDRGHRAGGQPVARGAAGAARGDSGNRAAGFDSRAAVTTNRRRW